MSYVKFHDPDVNREVQVFVQSTVDAVLPPGSKVSEEEPFPDVPIVPRNKWDWDLEELMK